MQASFIGFKRGHGDILLVCSRDILAPTLKRLSMFVLRAKAKLRDATAEFDLYGLAGNAAARHWRRACRSPGARRTSATPASLRSIRPTASRARCGWRPPAQPAPPGRALSHELWPWGEVRSGIATITAPIVEAFVPQMLNYESVGGVNFKKGCYPGPGGRGAQPVPRHAQAARLPGPLAGRPLQAGQEVFHESDPTSPAAWWRRPRRAPGGGWDAIVSIQIAAAQGGA